MTTDISGINALGTGEIESSADGGNNTRGVFGQVRPTGIMARGVAGVGRELPIGSDRAGDAKRKTSSSRRVGGR